jgi:tetratricopeptide (TPR) repeat protein
MMQMFKYLLVALVVLPGFSAYAQKKDLAFYQCAFFESYRKGDMSPWPGLIAEMEKVKPADLQWQTEMIKGMYGYVGYLLGQKKKDLARPYIEKADVHLEKLLKSNPRNARLHSLYGAFYGYKISLAVYKAPFLGPKSLSHIDKSIELDHKEPMGYIEKGNSLMYRPAAFGGDKKQALVLYRKALALQESAHNVKCNWQQLLLRAFILKGLLETDQLAEARTFKAAMEKDYGKMDWIEQFVGAEFIEKK